MIDVIGEEILWHGMPVADIHTKWHSATEMENFRRTIDQRVLIDVEAYDDVCGERDEFEREANASAGERDELSRDVAALRDKLEELAYMILDPKVTRPGLKAAAEAINMEEY